MSERSTFQQLAEQVGDVLEFAIGTLTEPVTRRAVIKDLGGNDDADPGTPDFPLDRLDSIRAYQSSADPDAEADIAVLTDIVLLLDAVAANVEAWDLGTAEGLDQLGQSLLDLIASNYVRLRFPRTYMWLQGLAAITDAMTTYGVGTSNPERMWSALKALGYFLTDPGKTLADLQPGAGAPDPGDPDRYRADRAVHDLLFRLGGATLGWLHGNDKIDVTGDVLVGWDGPGVDIDAGERPTVADVLSNRLVSFSLATASRDDDHDVELAEPIVITLGYVATDADTAALLVAFGGHLELEVPLGVRWTFSAKLRSDAFVAALIGSPFDFNGPPGANFGASLGWASIPDPTTKLSFALPRPTGTRLEIGQLAFSLALRSDGAEMRTDLTGAALVLDSEDSDGFIRRLLGGTPLRLPFDVAVGYGTGRGLILEGRVGGSSPSGPGVQNSPLAGDGPVGAPVLAVTVPVGRRFGPVTAHEVALRIARSSSTGDGGTDRVTVEADVTFSAQLGPVWFRLDRVGLGLVLDTSRPPAERNLRLVDARLATNPPLGIAVNIDTELVRGGGSIFHDPVQGTYFGVLALRLGDLLTLKAIGLVATRQPDGSPGSSFIVIATYEGLGIQIGPVTLDGIGLLYATDRTFDESAVRAALPTGQLRHVLFPADPVHHPAETLRPLSTFFPARPGSNLIGLLVKLMFGNPPIVRLDLALILQFGPSVSDRLIVLGRVSSILPSASVRIVQLNLDAVGIFDPSQGTAALDAVLVDSKLCGRFPLTGAAAFRRVPGARGFALAVGGFHPRYAAPPGFPALPRITVALTNGDNPKLVCQAYVAITANTVQFGASASLYAAACGFSLEGHVGFDVLIQLWPPHFLAEFRASVQLKRGSTNLFKISVQGALEGPLPLRISGKATFEILWWDYSISFDRTLVGGGTPAAVPLIDVLGQLLAVLGDAGSWRAEAPARANQLVTVRRDDRPGQVLMHPMGSLSVRQGVVPLNVQRDIDRVGEAVPSGGRRFAITAAVLGTSTPTRRPVRDQFAPGQFFDMTDDDRLAAPSFDEMEAGVAFGDDAHSFPAGAAVRSPFDYTDITIGADGTATVEPEPVVLDGPLVLVLAGLGAAALAPERRRAASRFATPLEPSPPATAAAPTLKAAGWAVAETASTAPAGTVTTWAEASAQLAGTVSASGDLVLVPAGWSG